MASLEECPHCGATYRRGRLACPECGSDAETGWQDQEELDYQSVDLPEAWLPEPGSPTPSWSRTRWQLAVVLGLLTAAIIALLW